LTAGLGTAVSFRTTSIRDPGPGAVDFACGPLSYDGHDGTDFAVPSLRRMQAGVSVLAVADGTVRAIRDGMPDTRYDPSLANQIAGRECGNGVLVDHADGWQTQYCHLKSGSVRVRPGQNIARGSALGQIGMSGQAQFPHVHLSVRKNTETVDPFHPDTKAACGTEPTDTMWSEPVPYSAGGLIAAGFSASIPSFSAIRSGDSAAAELPVSADALVLWAFVFGARDGDRLVFRDVGPSGEFLDETVGLTRTQAQLFRAVGRRRRAPEWPPGTYRGTASLIRGEVRISRIDAGVQVGK